MPGWCTSSCQRSTGSGMSPAGVETVGSPTRQPAPLQDGLQRTANTHEQGGEVPESPGTLRQNAQRFGVRVMVVDIRNHVQAVAAVRRNRVVHRGEQRRDQRLDLGSFSARTQAHPRLVAGRRHGPREHIDTQVHPRRTRQRLERLDDARLPCSRSAVEVTICPGLDIRQSCTSRATNTRRIHQPLFWDGPAMMSPGEPPCRTGPADPRAGIPRADRGARGAAWSDGQIWVRLPVLSFRRIWSQLGERRPTQRSVRCPRSPPTPPSAPRRW